LTRAAEDLARGDLERPIPRVGGDEIGRLGSAFERMRVALRGSLGEIAAANQRLEQRVAERTAELAERERARQRLLGQVITAQEEERKRLARELHDETCQTLAALALRLDLAQASPELRALAARCLDELRRLIHDLRPAVLDDLGLVPALRWYAERRLAAAGMTVRFEVGPLPERLPPALETALFRAVQELLNNVGRHAGAERVLVQVAAEGGRLVLEVEDDGAGFDPAAVRPARDEQRGLGLLGVHERVELFGGTLRVESAPGEGTRVVLEVPLGQDPRADR
ncbi:MAG TPA: ATP-binding protein, partial [Candidatus Polarisedimenticolaceae bacterium]|nr:ATP-binding protein [Candidatus Polarisedimenticolaceae bacterium]